MIVSTGTSSTSMIAHGCEIQAPSIHKLSPCPNQIYDRVHKVSLDYFINVPGQYSASGDIAQDNLCFPSIAGTCVENINLLTIMRLSPAIEDYSAQFFNGVLGLGPQRKFDNVDDKSKASPVPSFMSHFLN
jgi:hypothetical protein